jgi:hypothetical protein
MTRWRPLQARPSRAQTSALVFIGGIKTGAKLTHAPHAGRTSDRIFLCVLAEVSRARDALSALASAAGLPRIEFGWLCAWLRRMVVEYQPPDEATQRLQARVHRIAGFVRGIAEERDDKFEVARECTPMTARGCRVDLTSL